MMRVGLAAGAGIRAARDGFPDLVTSLPALPRTGFLASVVAGLDASLTMTSLGLMSALIVYSSVGPGALPYALAAMAVAIVVGGGLAMRIAPDIAIIAGPTATSALVLAALVDQLQRLLGGKIDVGLALSATAVVAIGAGVLQVLLARARLGSALKFIPYPVLMGFVDAVGVALVVSAIPYALGGHELGHLLRAATWFDDWKP